ncbi:MAG: glycosyltransferase, partial [Duncaniella sp.]|nr:glycosyltransferase [Duncaniella sp.]
MESPQVSIIVPAYNAAPYIGECLASIAAQTWRDFEVIVVDDGSTDGTADMTGEFCSHDPRFILVRAPHGGVSAARNLGIERARGEWIGFADADDCLHPHALE